VYCIRYAEVWARSDQMHWYSSEILCGSQEPIRVHCGPSSSVKAQRSAGLPVRAGHAPAVFCAPFQHGGSDADGVGDGADLTAGVPLVAAEPEAADVPGRAEDGPPAQAVRRATARRTTPPDRVPAARRSWRPADPAAH
jgi:hypothetical protein